MPFCKSLLSHKHHFKKNNIFASLQVSPDKFTQILSHCKRVFLTAFTKKQEASLTVEAAFVVPFFLFVTCNLIQVANFFYSDADRITRMSENAKNFAIYMYAVDKLVGDNILNSLGFGDFENSENCILFDDNIDLYEVSVEKPMFIPFGFGEYMTINRATCHMWTGYKIDGHDENEEEEEGEYVYITETGSVYHTFRDCRHIKLTIKSVAIGEITNATNSSGRHYRPCERCGNQEVGAFYYVTSGGVAYHNSVNCSSLKRTVSEITLNEALEQGRRICATCEGRGE